MAAIPFDHHGILETAARGGLFVVENTPQGWLNNASHVTALVVAHKMWQVLGVPDDRGVSQVGNHDQRMFQSSQAPERRAFIRRSLLDDAGANTTVMSTDGSFKVDEPRWVDWITPSLQWRGGARCPGPSKPAAGVAPPVSGVSTGKSWRRR
jgi:hypothetical protein